MTTSLVLHRASDGSDMQAVLSLSAIKSLNAAQVTALNGLGIRRVSDLLQFKPVHDARLVLLAARGQIAHDVTLADLLSPAGAALNVRDLAEAPGESRNLAILDWTRSQPVDWEPLCAGSSEKSIGRRIHAMVVAGRTPDRLCPNQAHPGSCAP